MSSQKDVGVSCVHACVGDYLCEINQGHRAIAYYIKNTAKPVEMFLKQHGMRSIMNRYDRKDVRYSTNEQY